MEITTISQDIINSVSKQKAEELKQAKKEGTLSKQEMILLYNILTNLYDIFDAEQFGCAKSDYKQIITRLDALTE